VSSKTPVAVLTAPSASIFIGRMRSRCATGDPRHLQTDGALATVRVPFKQWRMYLVLLANGR
jgi:hypothetical protein